MFIIEVLKPLMRRNAHGGKMTIKTQAEASACTHKGVCVWGGINYIKGTGRPGPFEGLQILMGLLMVPKLYPPFLPFSLPS